MNEKTDTNYWHLSQEDIRDAFKSTAPCDETAFAGYLNAIIARRLANKPNDLKPHVHVFEWKNESFSHEFGTEEGGLYVCRKCGKVADDRETREMEDMES